MAFNEEPRGHFKDFWVKINFENFLLEKLILLKVSLKKNNF
jgi:hypothetical protein